VTGRVLESDKELGQASVDSSSGWAWRNSPVFIAVIAAVASVVGAVISWNSASSATEQQYVAMAMEILSDNESSQPARNWAIGVVSDMSPTEVSPSLASGLLTGQSVLPRELDPSATRTEILECLQPVFESELGGPVEPAPLPRDVEDDLQLLKNWAKFSIAQTGQLEKANGRIEMYRDIMRSCISEPLQSVDKAN